MLDGEGTGIHSDIQTIDARIESRAYRNPRLRPRCKEHDLRAQSGGIVEFLSGPAIPASKGLPIHLQATAQEELDELTMKHWLQYGTPNGQKSITLFRRKSAIKTGRSQKRLRLKMCQ